MLRDAPGREQEQQLSSRPPLALSVVSKMRQRSKKQKEVRVLGSMILEAPWQWHQEAVATAEFPSFLSFSLVHINLGRSQCSGTELSLSLSLSLFVGCTCDAALAQDRPQEMAQHQFQRLRLQRRRRGHHRERVRVRRSVLKCFFHPSPYLCPVSFVRSSLLLNVKSLFSC